MSEYPTTVLELHDQFSNESACRQYLAKLRWPEGFVCPRCKGTEAWLTARGLYHCRGCDHQTSVTAGTLFSDTNLPVRLWFEAIWHMTNQKYGASALGMQRLLGLGSYHTAWNWMHKLRRGMVRPQRDRLAGEVEADEIYIGGERAGKRGRGAAGKALVLVMVQVSPQGAGRIRLARVADASAASLERALQQAVELGNRVRTDGWNGYGRLEQLGYQHAVARAEAAVGDNLLPLANRVASLLKRWLLGTHQGAVRTTHLDYYLDEFTFRFNRRTSRSRGLLFYRLLQQSVALDPVPTRSLVGGRANRKP
jgi:transposase-like protein